MIPVADGVDLRSVKGFTTVRGCCRMVLGQRTQRTG
jgi:hypothetical protein